jgi:hypothetical protein
MGKVGEELILEYERALVKSYGIQKEVEHTSKEKGDGLGYDILSFDENGQPKYIEVKATSGHCFAPFYITANELHCSETYPNNYYLYRLHSYNSINHSTIFYQMKGPLTEFCNNPVLYKAVTHG